MNCSFHLRDDSSGDFYRNGNAQEQFDFAYDEDFPDSLQREWARERAGMRLAADDGLFENGRARRFSSQMIDPRLSQNGARNVSGGSEGRKRGYYGGMFGESDSGISEYGLGSSYSVSQDNLINGRANDGSLSRRLARKSRRRRRSMAQDANQRSRYSGGNQLIMQPREISQVYFNDAYINDSIV